MRKVKHLVMVSLGVLFASSLQPPGFHAAWRRIALDQ